MKKLILFLFMGMIANVARAAVVVKIESMNNLANNTAIEVCGTAASAKKAKVAVTVTHGEAEYTTMASPRGKWCVVVKRWSFSGEVDAEGIEL